MLNHRLSRRDVLKGAAATAAVLAIPTIVPSTVFGQNAPSNRVAIAGIGVGNRGGGDLQHQFLPLPDVQLVAACDCFKSRREGFAAMCNKHYKADVCKPYADFREVLARKDIDAVVISTQDHWHVPLAYYAAQAGKDMYVEKPLGVAMAWAWKLREAVAKNQRVFQYGTQQRGDQKQFRRACELVRNGYIGKITSVDAWCPDMSQQFNQASDKHYGTTKESAPPADLDYEMWIGPSPMKPYTADRCTCYGGYHIYDYALGFIAGWGAHPLDIAQWGLDMDNSGPVKYEGKGTIPPKGSLWDSIESWDIQAEYANGIKLHFMGDRVAQPVVKAYHPVFHNHGTTFHGTEGWLSVDRNGLYSSNKALQKAEIKPTEKHLINAGSQARNFVDCIKSRAATINPLESAIRSDTISHLSDLCIRLGRAINWDPQKEQIINDEEATKLLDRPMRQPWKLS